MWVTERVQYAGMGIAAGLRWQKDLGRDARESRRHLSPVRSVFCVSYTVSDIRIEICRYNSHGLVKILQGLWKLDPRQRLTAEQALDAGWFWTEPLPAEPQT